MKRNYLGAGEINRMRVARRIVEAYKSRKTSSNPATWAAENLDDCYLLMDAASAYEEIKNG